MERSAAHWTPVAMVRITGFLLLGVIIAHMQTEPVRLLFGLSPKHRMICEIAWGIFAGCSILLRHQRSAWWGFFRLSGIAVTGYMLAWKADDRLSKNHLVAYEGKIQAIIGTVSRAPVKVSSGFRTLVIAKAAQTDSGWVSTSGHVAVYAPDSTLLPGDRILIPGHPVTFRENMNPDGINVAEVMAKSNIYLSMRTYGRAVIRLPETPESSSVLITIFRWSTEMRSWCIARLSKLSVNKADETLTEALVLGVTSGLDPEISQPFAATGTLHVLAVSGMHVGIIYGIILLTLSPLAFWSGNRWTTAVLGILLLWFYAFITGLSPSVLRAVVMFSLITAARPFGVRTNIWNTIAASAFLLILFDPFLITRVGFLLSYLAVAGIVWIAPMLKSHLESESRWLNWIWTTLCVTTAAQILTLPVTMSWFGKVPTYFLPANLFIIPLSTISLGLSLAGLVLGDVLMCQELIKFLLFHALKAMTQTAIFFEQLPGSVIEVNQISAFQGFLWVGIIVAFICHVRWSRAAPLFLSVFLAFICSIVDWKHRYEQTYEAILTVYHWPGKTFLALRANKSLMVMAPQNPLLSGTDVPSDIITGVLRRSTDHYSFYPDSVGAARFRIGKNQWYYINGDVRGRLTDGVVILGTKGGSSLEDVCADVVVAASGTTVKQESLAGCNTRIHRVARDGAYIYRVPVSGAGDD